MLEAERDVVLNGVSEGAAGIPQAGDGLTGVIRAAAEAELPYLHAAAEGKVHISGPALRKRGVRGLREEEVVQQLSPELLFRFKDNIRLDDLQRNQGRRLL